MSNTTTQVTVTTPTGTDDEGRNTVTAYLADHVWLPVIGSLVVLVVVIGISYVVCRIRRHRRYEYTIVDEEEDDLATQSAQVLRQKTMNKIAQRDTALLNCSFFLRSSGEYTMVDQLPEIGGRDTKQWFLVHDKEKPKQYVLTVIPKGRDMLLPFTSNTEKYLNELFMSMEHPYVYPIKEVCFQYDMEQFIIVNPYNRRGSIKDYLHSCHCLDSWDMKYSMLGKPHTVHLPMLKLYGRQILEGMMYLKSKGFPYYGHLHSGNVIVEDRVCRLTGYENSMLSINPKLKRLLKRYPDMKHFDVLSFGHLLYEMAIGEELDTAIPESRHYLVVKHLELLEVLKFIFNVQSEKYPSIKKISQHVFFKSETLSEMVLFTPSQYQLHPGVKNLLKSIKKGAVVPKKKTRNSSRHESQSSVFISPGSEHSFGSLSSSRTPSSTHTPSQQQMVPMTTILSTSTHEQPREEQFPPVEVFTSKPHAKLSQPQHRNSGYIDMDNMNTMGDDNNTMQGPNYKGKGKRKKKGSRSSTTESVSSVATSSLMGTTPSRKVPEINAEMTALLCEIKTVGPLKKTSYSRFMGGTSGGNDNV